MRIDVLSLFPAIATAALCESMMKRAQEKGLFTFKSHDLRDWTHDKYRRADDAPYGGGQGMVMKCEPIFEAVESLRTPETRVVFMGPCGRRLDQRIAQEYSGFGAKGGHLIILCGHYEGVDQRVLDHLVDDEISVGDYVLTNGVIAAVVFVDAIVRLIPGVLGDDASATDDSFATGLLEFPPLHPPARVSRLENPRHPAQRQPREHRTLAPRASPRTHASAQAGFAATGCRLKEHASLQIADCRVRVYRYFSPMSVQELEAAVTQLPKEELARFSQWFEEYIADAWDRQIEADALAGRFDAAGKRAKADHEAGRCTPL